MWPDGHHISSTIGRVGVTVVLLYVGIVLGAAPHSLYAQDVGAGSFSRMGMDARGIALGNALLADSTTDVSPYYNPALMTLATGQRVSGAAAALAFDRQLQSLEFTTPVGPTAGVGLGLVHAGVTGIDGRNSDGVHTEDLSTDEFALSLSFGNRFADRLSVGVQMTLYQSDLVPDASPVRGFGVDLGVAYQVSSQFRVAGAVSDLLAKYEWEGGRVRGRSQIDDFPVRVQVGASYSLLGGRVRLLGEVESRTVNRQRAVTDQIVTTNTGPREQRGLEEYRIVTYRGRVGIAYRPIDILALRAGLDRIGVQGRRGLQPSAGFGLRQQVGELDLRVSYAASVEPHVRTLMNVGTIEVFL